MGFEFENCYYRNADGWCCYANEHCAYVDSWECALTEDD